MKDPFNDGYGAYMRRIRGDEIRAQLTRPDYIDYIRGQSVGGGRWENNGLSKWEIGSGWDRPVLPEDCNKVLNKKLLLC